jgi:hypothetical protein
MMTRYPVDDYERTAQGAANDRSAVARHLRRDGLASVAVIAKFTWSRCSSRTAWHVRTQLGPEHIPEVLEVMTGSQLVSWVLYPVLGPRRNITTEASGVAAYR